MFLLLLFQETLGVPEETAEDALKLVRENGPWVYELFAVLIHSGSALGGHYYAHIKSLGDGGKRQGAAAAFFLLFFVQNSEEVRICIVLRGIHGFPKGKPRAPLF